MDKIMSFERILHVWGNFSDAFVVFRIGHILALHILIYYLVAVKNII